MLIFHNPSNARRASYVPLAFLRWNSWTSILPNNVILLHAIRSLFYWRILQETILFSSFKTPYKKSGKQENSSVFMTIHEQRFVERIMGGRKPDKQSSLARLEFRLGTPYQHGVPEFHLCKCRVPHSAVYTHMTLYLLSSNVRDCLQPTTPFSATMGKNNYPYTPPHWYCPFCLVIRILYYCTNTSSKTNNIVTNL